MSIKFDIKNETFKEALKKMDNINYSEEHWKNVLAVLNGEEKKAKKLFDVQKLDDNLLHRAFTI